MLKIYSDRTLVHPGQRHVIMLYPFWGKLPEDPRNPATGRYDRYLEVGRSLVTMTSLPEADLAVLPLPWEDVWNDESARRCASEFIARARAHGKPVAAFFWDDSVKPVPLEHTLIFRTSMYRSRKKPTEFAMPAWSEDLLEKYLGGQVPLRPKQERPVVGFCGWAGLTGPQGSAGPLRGSFKRRFRRFLNQLAAQLGVRDIDTTRAEALRLLSRSPLIETNFVIRDRYLGGPTILNETQDPDVVRRLRVEFVQNLVESDYVLCVRGTGNYSYRLYETLSCGRIPIFVDTDCVLPYDFSVDWKQYCVWVEQREISRIAEKVAEFHARLTPSEFEELQLACRRFWEEKLSVVGFFSHLDQHLRLPVHLSVPSR